MGAPIVFLAAVTGNPINAPVPGLRRQQFRGRFWRIEAHNFFLCEPMPNMGRAGEGLGGRVTCLPHMGLNRVPPVGNRCSSLGRMFILMNMERGYLLGSQTYIYHWDRHGRKGQFCLVLVCGKMNSYLIKFEDGYTMVTSRNALKLANSDLSRLAAPPKLKSDDAVAYAGRDHPAHASAGRDDVKILKNIQGRSRKSSICYLAMPVAHFPLPA
jgi:hypothetical protein